MRKTAMPTTAPRPWYVYLLACRRGTYVGITNDLLRRYRAHCAGRGARYTRANPPQAILGARAFADRAEASRMEYWLKRQTPEDKRRWIAAAPLPPEVVAALAATDATS